MGSRLIALLMTVSVLLTVLAGTYVHPLQAVAPPPQPVVSVHFDISKPDIAKKLVDYAAELGARFVRFDIWWRDIEPEMGQFNYTALLIYRDTISYMLSKGLYPIVILGSNGGYPQWARDLLNQYSLCVSDCYSYPVSHPSVCTADASTAFNSTINSSPEWIRDAVKKSVEAYLKHGGPETELKTIEYIVKTCPDYYKASAKGFLTREELAEISKTCPTLPIKVSPAELEKGVVYVKPLPQTYEALKRAVKSGPGAASVNGAGVLSEAYTGNNCVHQCYYYISAFLNESYKYAYVVSSWLWGVHYYQLGNEQNHFIDPVPDQFDAAFIEALGRGVDGDPGDRYKIVNAFANWLGWESALKSWLGSAGGFIDIVAIDHYPGTWTATGPTDWSPLDKLISIANSYGKTPAIMETGYPTEAYPLNIPKNVRDENMQAQYINTAFSEIMKRTQNTYIAFLTWYMLWDEQPETCENIAFVKYCGWGVLRPDFSKKPAWDTLSYWFKYRLF